MVNNLEPLAETVGFEILGHGLSEDVQSALQYALRHGAVFVNEGDSLALFRQALSDSIRNIESHPRGRVFQKFMQQGPYEDIGEIPADLVGQRLSDADCASAIAFIYSHMVNCFKGAVTEFLAVKPCSILLRRLQDEDKLPKNARLYVGDSVAIQRVRKRGFLKGADQHILIEEKRKERDSSITVVGLTEVKSYIQSEQRLQKQLDQHLLRARRGLRVCDIDYPADKVNVGLGKDEQVFRIAVMPSSWRLPRSFWFEDSESCRELHVNSGTPPRREDEIKQIDDYDWRITLRWSKEALAEVAYEMTFWYMEKVGEVIYTKSVPNRWKEMTPARAGRNAATMMLYYAILRSRTIREEQRAIALYNAYGYGYALGMNYKNAEGRREMLWPQDLDEILSAGETENGCRLH